LIDPICCQNASRRPSPDAYQNPKSNVCAVQPCLPLWAFWSEPDPISVLQSSNWRGTPTFPVWPTRSVLANVVVQKSSVECRGVRRSYSCSPERRAIVLQQVPY